VLPIERGLKHRIRFQAGQIHLLMITNYPAHIQSGSNPDMNRSTVPARISGSRHWLSGRIAVQSGGRPASIYPLPKRQSSPVRRQALLTVAAAFRQQDQMS